METVDTIVIGAGVVGLAIARSLALAGREVLILEAEAAFGTQTSARNSEVIHAGLYYPRDSLKAALCVRGKELLYRYCAERNIPHRRLGKLLIATDASELAALASYAQRAAGNGVPLEPLTAAEVLRLEPAVRAIAGLYSESTGILDSHQLMVALLGDAEQAGAMLVAHTPVVAGKIESDGFLLRTGGDDPFELRCRMLVNSAGLYAQELARRLEGFPSRTRAAHVLRQGPLLHPQWACAIPAPRLPDAGSCRPRHSRDTRPGWPVQVRTRRQRLACIARLFIRSGFGGQVLPGNPPLLP